MWRLIPSSPLPIRLRQYKPISIHIQRHNHVQAGWFSVVHLDPLSHRHLKQDLVIPYPLLLQKIQRLLPIFLRSRGKNDDFVPGGYPVQIKYPGLG